MVSCKQLHPPCQEPDNRRKCNLWDGQLNKCDCNKELLWWVLPLFAIHCAGCFSIWKQSFNWSHHQRLSKRFVSDTSIVRASILTQHMIEISAVNENSISVVQLLQADKEFIQIEFIFEVGWRRLTSSLHWIFYLHGLYLQWYIIYLLIHIRIIIHLP